MAPMAAPRMGPHIADGATGGPACRRVRPDNAGINARASRTPVSTGEACAISTRAWALAASICSASRLIEQIEAANAQALVRIAQDSPVRSEEHTSELPSRPHIVCRLLLVK